MICTSCKNAQATVFIKQIVNNQVTQSALCLDCAGEAGAALDPTAALLKLLGGAPPRSRAAAARCPSCSMGFAQFKESIRLGCARCYDHFEPQLKSLIPRFQGGASSHRGKTPRRRAA